MNILLSLLSFFILSPESVTTSTLSDHLGKWNYTVDSPDVTYKGVIEFDGKKGAYTGTLRSDDGTIIKLTDITYADSKLQFKMNVQGYPCTVNAKIDKDSLRGTVSVEGIEMPLIGSRI